MIVSSVFILLAALGLLTAGIYTDSNSYLYSSIAASLLAGVALFFGARSRTRRNEEAALRARQKARSVSKRTVGDRDNSRVSEGPAPSTWGVTEPSSVDSRETATEEFTRINDVLPPNGQGLPPRTKEAGSPGHAAGKPPTHQVPSQRLSTASPPYRDVPGSDSHSTSPHTPSRGTRAPNHLPPPGDWPPIDGPGQSTSEPRSQWGHWDELAPEVGGDSAPALGTDERFAALTENVPADGADVSGRHSLARAGSTGEFEQLRSDIAQWSEAAHEAANWEDGPSDEPSARELSSIEAAQLMRLEAVVQVIDGRPRFHLDSCTHLMGRDKEPLDLNEAIELGFSPCGLCDPVTQLSVAPALH